MAKTITILGSTGSIGQSTLSLLRDHPGEFDVKCLTAHTNFTGLAAQALEFRPDLVVIGDESKRNDLALALNGSGVEVAAGAGALKEAGGYPSDFVMAAIVGAAGLEPTLCAVKRGAMIGLANKECLVCAGDLFMQAAADNGATILPVDSEHNAIFQVLNQERPQEVRKLILTASGGPFRELPMDAMQTITREQALAHPVWEMGAKISIDSATLMNKGLELIEASYLFNRHSSEIDIIVHPQSIVHSLVSYIDGSVLAQLGSPDMRTPIAYALAWPQRMGASVEILDLAQIAKLEFYAPDDEKFKSLKLARTALEVGGVAPTVLNAANEVAVAAFLRDEISFLGIPECIENVLNRFQSEAGFAKSAHSIDEILAIDAETRRLTKAQI